MKANPYLPGTPDEFIEANLGLAQDVAWRFYLKSKQDERIKFDKDDFLSIAYMGLIKAYLKFDPTKFSGTNGEEIKFSTFAVPTIRGEIMRQIRDQGHTIRRHREYCAAEIDSLDRPLFEGEEKTLGDVVQNVGFIDEKQIVANNFLNSISPRLRKVYKLRTFGLSQQEVGEILGVTQVSVGRMERYMLESARQYGLDRDFESKWSEAV